MKRRQEGGPQVHTVILPPTLAAKETHLQGW